MEEASERAREKYNADKSESNDRLITIITASYHGIIVSIYFK